MFIVCLSDGGLCCVAVLRHLAGSLVGHLLPRVMLHERGIPVLSVEFSKTESNKPYICTVRYLSFPLSVWGEASVVADDSPVQGY